MRQFPIIRAVLAVLICGEAVRADPSWAYNWTTTNAVLKTQTGGVTLAPTPADVGNGSQDVTVALVTTFQSFDAPGVETLTNGGYSFDLELTDQASGQKATMTFSGVLTGMFSSSLIDLQNSFLTGPQEVDLGVNHYTVRMLSFTQPTPGINGEAGKFIARIDVAAKSPPVKDAPEPAGLALVGSGLPAVLWWWRKRRTTR